MVAQKKRELWGNDQTNKKNKTTDSKTWQDWLQNITLLILCIWHLLYFSQHLSITIWKEHSWKCWGRCNIRKKWLQGFGIRALTGVSKLPHTHTHTSPNWAQILSNFKAYVFFSSPIFAVEELKQPHSFCLEHSPEYTQLLLLFKQRKNVPL